MRVRKPSAAVAAEEGGQRRQLAVAEHAVEEPAVDAVEVDEQYAGPLRRARTGGLRPFSQLADTALADELRRLDERAPGAGDEDGQHESRKRRLSVLSARSVGHGRLSNRRAGNAIEILTGIRRTGRQQLHRRPPVRVRVEPSRPAV
jgi:hypothetical protein